MAAFPKIYRDAGNTIEQTPVVGDFEDVLAFDPTIRSRFEGGYVSTRARFTRLPRAWTIRFSGATQAGKDLIKAFENKHKGGSLAFTWTNPEDKAAYSVRFLGAVVYKAWPHTNYARWDIEFVLEQV